MKGMAEFLAKLVVPVWSVVAALLGTGGVLIGVGLPTWNSRQPLRTQPAKQSAANRIAREMALRREVCMEAAAAMTRPLRALLQLANSSRSFSTAAVEPGANPDRGATAAGSRPKPTCAPC